MKPRCRAADLMLRSALAAIALMLPAAAGAHNFWLEPETHRLEEPGEVRLEFKVGDTGEEAADWPVYWERIVGLRLSGPDGVSDQQQAVRTTRRGVTGGASVALDLPGTYVLAFESTASFSDLEAERFDRYVANEGLTAIAEHRARFGRSAKSGTELYSRRAKTVLQVGWEQTPNVTQRVGHTLEIVPHQNPYSMGEGEQLPLSVWFRGKRLAGAKLTAAAIDGSVEVRSYQTGEEGEVTIPYQHGTPMLYTVVWGVPAPNDARADYLTYFASLTVDPR